MRFDGVSGGLMEASVEFREISRGVLGVLGAFQRLVGSFGGIQGASLGFSEGLKALWRLSRGS